MCYAQTNSTPADLTDYLIRCKSGECSGAVLILNRLWHKVVYFICTSKVDPMLHTILLINLKSYSEEEQHTTFFILLK